MKTTDNIRSFCNIHCEGRSKEEKDAMIKELTDLVTQAIADHEQSKWKKYPENKPELEKLYDVTLIDYRVEVWSYRSKYAWDNMVRAFRDRPTPYKEDKKEGGEG